MTTDRISEKGGTSPTIGLRPIRGSRECTIRFMAWPLLVSMRPPRRLWGSASPTLPRKDGVRVYLTNGMSPEAMQELERCESIEV